MAGLNFEVSGGAKLAVVAQHYRAVGDRGLGRQMSKALTDVTKPLQRDIRDEADRTMPVRGGYRATVARSLRFRTSVSTAARSASVRLITYADGKSERRDVVALDAGRLRHPVFGRSGRRGGRRVARPWATTSIRAGFYARPTRDAGDKVARQMHGVLDALYTELKG